MKKFWLTKEGEFSTIKEITKQMSNGHANHLVQNSLLRIQVENLMPKKIILHLQTERNRGKSVMKDTFEKFQLCKKYLRPWRIGI